jgi:hypothetical protein
LKWKGGKRIVEQTGETKVKGVSNVPSAYGTMELVFKRGNGLFVF